MGKLMNALEAVGKVASALGERNMEIDEMTRELMKRSYGVDPIEARKIATVLVDRAEVTWK